MSLFHSHAHDPGHEHDHGHGHGGHDHGGDPPSGDEGPHRRGRLALRISLAVLCVLVAAAVASFVQVRSGQAMVVTRFGQPVRILIEPGLAWRLPAPIEAAMPVDLRLHTTSSGLQDVGTRDGSRIIVQAYVAWRVDGQSSDVARFVRAVRNEPDEAARQIRSLLGSALQTTSARFDLASLVNTDPAQVQIATFEETLRRQIEAQLRTAYGVQVVQVGLERLTLPAVTLAATVQRMSAERETVAAQRMADGTREAAQIRADADRQARETVADANVKAAEIEAQSRKDAAAIYGKAYAANPRLYTMLRSLDTLDAVVNSNTSLIVRTDAAPFSALVHGPVGLDATVPAAVSTPASPPAKRGHRTP